ncbi:MAG TPA: hypothetical protein PK335_08490 [Draconibacterium sp.]|nr:hypothetical protein [Draconibacterium sp.]
MKVCGFTFIRNAVKFDFPVVEAINSILPVCDHFVVAVGKSDDDTLPLIQSINPDKITIVETVWDENRREGGQVYADETDKAFDAIPEEYDWCFYIQGDEVVHEQYLLNVKKAMEDNLDKTEVEGLLFKYLHFYGSFDYVGDSRHWYRNEIRVIRNNKKIRSYRDAQGFRKDNIKLKVVPIDAYIYHYGWVRHPKYMQEKVNAVKAYYGGLSDEEAQQKAAEEEFQYGEKKHSVRKFSGTHPKVMQKRVERLNWDFNPDLVKVKMDLRHSILHWIEKKFGKRLFEYRNYEILK